MKRSARFLIGAAIGLMLGLLYGWVIRPVEYVDTAPEALRSDYKTDYVLMVAEAYLFDQDLTTARIRLAALGPRPPVNLVVEAIDVGLEHRYTQHELETMNRLAEDLRSLPIAPEIDTP